MKWLTTDIDLYLQSKEYVDTALIPLIPIGFGDQMKNIVLQGEFITTLSLEVERQFKGRLFLMPSFTYWKADSIEGEFERIQTLKKQLLNQGMKHVLYMTSDADWKQYENELGSSLLWLPAVPLEHVENKYKQKIVTDQVQQVVPQILNAWRN
ncbi:YpiF family protein [Bacillus salitolerans]|uniref:YpiF family protein n=1 Tax=Bacillus salitolerans TaxID=1437434 RepID=A0ABW4LVU3_9BACI